MSQTRYEWLVAEIATQMIRTPSVAMFPIGSVQNLEFILSSSSPKIAIVEDPKQLKKFSHLKSSIHTFVVFDPEASLETPDEEGHSDTKLDEALVESIDGDVVLYSDLISFGRSALAEDRSPISKIRRKTSRDDIACIMYTSGTSGNKKGVVISHANIMTQLSALEKFEIFKEGQTHLLSLPLAHIFAKVLLWLAVKNGTETIVGRGIGSLVADALEVHPEIIGLVPSLVENFESGIRKDFSKFGSLRLKILNTLWGAQRGGADLFNSPTFDPVGTWKKKISAQVGRASIQRVLGDSISTFITGGAEVAPESIGFFNKIGINITQLYGLTETTGIVSVSKNDVHSAGEVIDCCDIALNDNGEIYVRGPMVSAGYFDVGNIIALVNEEGWLATGDIGEFDAQGRIKVLGRLGDTIVTSGGRKIEPHHFELALENYPEIERAFLCGHKKPYAVALIQASEGVGIERVLELVENVNAEVATTDTIREVRLIEVPFSAERGELSESGRFHRDAIMRSRAAILSSMYEKKKHRRLISP